MNNIIRAGIIAAVSITAMVLLLTAFTMPQETGASKPLSLAKSSHSFELGLYDFGPCSGYSFTGAPGTADNPAIVRRGNTTTIHICGMNKDPSTKTYVFDVYDLGNPYISLKNGSANIKGKFPAFALGRPVGDGLHVSYQRAITVPAYSQGKDIPDMSHLKTADDLRSFVHTYMHGRKPDFSHFDVHVSADANATLGVHAFWLVSKFPMKPVGNHINAEVIAVKVVP